MSWIISNVEVFGDTAEGDLEDAQPIGQDGERPDVAQAVHAAKQAAVALIRSGAVGNPGDNFRVSLNGHSNPDHRPTEGWANDAISVHVTQI